MITKFSHATIYVTDHDQALDFYVGKLGFEVRTDVTMQGFRWLTVGPKAQPDLELILMRLSASPMMDADTVAQMESLMRKGALGAGVFATDDCKATYEALLAKGVEFVSPPAERPYGIEAIMKVPFGNWFSVSQRAR